MPERTWDSHRLDLEGSALVDGNTATSKRRVTDEFGEQAARSPGSARKVSNPPRRNAYIEPMRREVSQYDGSRTDDAALTNGHSWKDRRSASDPTAILDSNWRSDGWPTPPRGSRVFVCRGPEKHFESDLTVVPDRDLGAVIEHATNVNRASNADCDSGATEEATLAHGSCSYAHAGGVEKETTSPPRAERRANDGV